MSWQWRMKQKLTRNWLVVLKLTWGTSQILTRALKSLKKLCFNWLLVTKVYIVWATKVQRSYLSTLKRYANFEEKLTCSLKKDLRNLANFHQSTWKCQIWDFDGILLSKVEKVWLWNLQKSYVSWQWRIMQNLKRNWLVISKMTWGI